MDIQWPLLIFSLFAGCGGALLASAGVASVLGFAQKTRFPALVAALILLIVGGFASVLHLGQPANIMAAATNIFSFSGISVELIMLGINVIVALILLVLVKREGSEGALKAVGILAILVGIVMAFVVGNGYVLVGQPYWNTITLPLAYLGSGLALGATLFASLMVFLKEGADQLKRFIPVVLGVIVFQTIAFGAYGFVIGFAGDAMLYWVGAVVIGCAAALVCVLLYAKNQQLIFAACICTIVGGICFRALMWTLGVGYLDLFGTAATRSILGF